jgi:hypothetical protein
MPSRKKPRVHETVPFKSYPWNNHTLEPETIVEVSSGDFLLIKAIFRQDQAIILSGLLLRRNTDFGAKLPKKLNEVYFVHRKWVRNISAADIRTATCVSIYCCLVSVSTAYITKSVVREDHLWC